MDISKRAYTKLCKGGEIMNTRDVVASNIRKEMNARNLSARKLSEVSGVTRRQLSYILRSEKDLKISTLDKISTGLGISVADLFKEI